MEDGVNRNINMNNINFDAKVPKQPKKNIILRILSLPFRIMLAMVGINWDEIKDDHNGVHTTNTVSQQYHEPSGHQTFVNTHRAEHSPFSAQGFDPIQAANLKMYLGGFDGKGDDDHCH